MIRMEQNSLGCKSFNIIVKKLPYTRNLRRTQKLSYNIFSSPSPSLYVAGLGFVLYYEHKITEIMEICYGSD